MKRYGNLYEEFISEDNFRLALLNASRGKSKRCSVKECLNHQDEHYKCVKRFKTFDGHYRHKTIIDEPSHKEREIIIPQFFPDQVMHHMLIQATEHALMGGAYEYSCGSVKNKGAGLMLKYLKRQIRCNQPQTKYFVKIDIRHYYQSISHERLKKLIRTKIKDFRILRLYDTLIDSVSKGLPIGNYSSQYLANFYLQAYDHYVKNDLRIPVYVRYVDDMVFMGPSKRKLMKSIIKAKKYLKDNLGLETHGNETAQSLAYKDKGGAIRGQPLDFVGFRFFRDHTDIRKRDYISIRRTFLRCHRFIEMNKFVPCSLVLRTLSYLSFTSSSDSKTLMNRYLPSRNITFLKRAARVSSERRMA